MLQLQVAVYYFVLQGSPWYSQERDVGLEIRSWSLHKSDVRELLISFVSFDSRRTNPNLP